jgi:hypothetical protein
MVRLDFRFLPRRNTVACILPPIIAALLSCIFITVRPIADLSGNFAFLVSTLQFLYFYPAGTLSTLIESSGGFKTSLYRSSAPELNDGRYQFIYQLCVSSEAWLRWHTPTSSYTLLFYAIDAWAPTEVLRAKRLKRGSFAHSVWSLWHCLVGSPSLRLYENRARLMNMILR